MKRVLAADGNLAFLRETQAQLQGAYEVMLARSGEAALHLIRHKKPDLFLLDLEMPDMDGFELLAVIQEQPSLAGIPVIFYTTQEDTPALSRAIQAGARDFVIKPAARDMLLHRIGLHIQLADYLGRVEETVAALSGIMTESFAELINYRYKMEGHSERIPRLCGVLGRELLRRKTFPEELSAEDLDMIVKAVPLHDIGNITIPDSIMLKPGPLSPEEREQMKKHSYRGAGILEHFALRIPTQRFIHYARLIALTHHEAWNGEGYPMGLAEDAIPLCGRLTAVADVYDDVSCDRVYRKRMDHRGACRIIAAEKGKRFDPRIVDAFEAVAEEMREALSV